MNPDGTPAPAAGMSSSQKIALGCIGCLGVQVVLALATIVALSVVGASLDSLFQDVSQELEQGEP